MRCLIAALFAITLASVVSAQVPEQTAEATLVADSLRIEGDGLLIAEGNVEVFYGSSRLSASRVAYNAQDESLQIEGPIRLTDPDGNVLIASSAELDSNLADGILQSARFVLDQQLQLAANRIARSGGRFTRLDQVVASSCEVCAGETPLWEIRASRVLHDQTERQLYFSQAQFRFAGVPIFYIPRLRLPDPTQDRATGFLVPEIRTTNQLSTGLKFPYFIALGESADLTLAPYLSSSTTTLEAVFRQAFANGELVFDGAFTPNDDILLDESRGYAFLQGQLRFPNDYRVDLDFEYTTDPAYGLDYGYFSKDRLDSAATLSRTRRDSFLRTGVIVYETLRAADAGLEDTLPRSTAELFYTQSLPTGDFGGDAWLSLDARAIERPSNADILGRDVSQVGAALDWRREWTAPQGLIVATEAALGVEAYSVTDDSTLQSAPFRSSQRAGVTLRWPFERITTTGARQLLEPVAQLLWSDEAGDRVPNEDSLVVELDEGNLFSFSRFPGTDAIETDLRANIGVNWLHRASTGLTLGVTAGRIIRFGEEMAFAAGTGLTGRVSDWFAAVRLDRPDGLSLVNRTLIDSRLEFTRNETRLNWLAEWGSVATSYIWALPVPEENRPDRLSEWGLAAEYELTRNWQGGVSWRYDFVADRAAEAGLGLTYTNECIDMNLSLSRRFTSSTSIEPTTDIGISVSLNGFGTGRDGVPYRRGCSG